jgi:hypothetical protein
LIVIWPITSALSVDQATWLLNYVPPQDCWTWYQQDDLMIWVFVLIFNMSIGISFIYITCYNTQEAFFLYAVMRHAA